MRQLCQVCLYWVQVPFGRCGMEFVATDWGYERIWVLGGSVHSMRNVVWSTRVTSSSGALRPCGQSSRVMVTV